MCFILMLKFPVCNNLAKFNRVPRSVRKFGPSNSINIQKTQKYMPSGESGWGPFSIGTFTASRFYCRSAVIKERGSAVSGSSTLPVFLESLGRVPTDFVHATLPLEMCG